MHHGTLSQIDLEISSIMTIKMKGLIFDPWCSHTLVGKDSVIPTGVRMLVDTLLYILCITLMYLREIPLYLRLPQTMLRGMLSYVFSMSMNTICKSFFRSLYFSISLLKRWIVSVVDLSDMNPNCFSLITVFRLILFSINLSHSFIVWLRILIPLWFPHTCASPLFLNSGIRWHYRG